MYKPFSFDPLVATYHYETRFDPGSQYHVGGRYGILGINDDYEKRTWGIDASTHCFEADLCECGTDGCGLMDVHVHRSGPYISWTCWNRRIGTPADFPDLPLVLGAEGYQQALGGSTESLPWLDAIHARELIRPVDAPVTSDVLWWIQDEPDVLGIDPKQLYESIHEPDSCWLTDVSLVQKPVDAWSLDHDGWGGLMWAACVDGALAVQFGSLLRFPVMLRLGGYLLNR